MLQNKELPLLGNWTLDPKKSSIGFHTKYLLFKKVSGQFQQFDGTLNVSGNQKIESLDLALNIDTASLTTHASARDNFLRSSSFFDTQTFPTAFFRSTGFKQISENQILVQGNLTIKEHTKQESFAVTVQKVFRSGSEMVAGVYAESVIRRSDYGLEWDAAGSASKFLVGDEITITAHLQATK